MAGATWQADKTATGWVLKVERGGLTAVLEYGSNRLRLGQRGEVDLEAPAVCVEQSGQWYLPSQAARLIMGQGQVRQRAKPQG